LISPTGMDSFVPPSDRMSLRESGKRSPDYRFRAHIYTIRAGYTQFSVIYTQFQSAIHNSLQLYTIRSSYTQFVPAIHNSDQLYTIRAQLYTIPRRSRSTEPVRMRSATPSTGCIRSRDTPVIAPGRVFRRHNTVADESTCKVVSRAAAPRPTEPDHLYTIPRSYTQFVPAIHNSFRLYTIPVIYTQFAPAFVAPSDPPSSRRRTLGVRAGRTAVQSVEPDLDRQSIAPRYPNFIRRRRPRGWRGLKHEVERSMDRPPFPGHNAPAPLKRVSDRRRTCAWWPVALWSTFDEAGLTGGTFCS